jgi:hypothetical protein
LDSIVEKVGAKALWEYILYRIQLPELTSKRFNIGKVVTIPDADNDEFFPEIVSNFESHVDAWKRKQLDEVKEYLRNLLEYRRNEIKLELENHELVKSEDKEAEIKDELKSIVDKDKSEDKQNIIAKFDQLMQPGVLPAIETDNKIKSNDAKAST